MYSEELPIIKCEKGVYTRRTSGYDIAVLTKGTNKNNIFDRIDSNKLSQNGPSIKIDLCRPAFSGEIGEFVRIMHTYASPFGERGSKTTDTAFIPINVFIAHPELAYSSQLFACCCQKPEFDKKEQSYVQGEQLLQQNPVEIDSSLLTKSMTTDEKLEALGINITQLHYLLGAIICDSLVGKKFGIHIEGLPHNQSLPIFMALLCETHKEDLCKIDNSKITNYDNAGMIIIFDDNTLPLAQSENLSVLNISQLNDYDAMGKKLGASLEKMTAMMHSIPNEAKRVLINLIQESVEAISSTKTSLFASKERKEKTRKLQELSNELDRIKNLKQTDELIEELKKLQSCQEAFAIISNYNSLKRKIDVLSKIIDTFQQSLINQNVK